MYHQYRDFSDTIREHSRGLNDFWSDALGTAANLFTQGKYSNYSPTPVFASNTDYTTPSGSSGNTVSDWSSGSTPTNGSTFNQSGYVIGNNGTTVSNPGTSGSNPNPIPQVIPQGMNLNSQGTLVQTDVNAGSNPNNPQGWGIDFGYGQSAIDAYKAYPGQVDAQYQSILDEIARQKGEAQNTYPDLEKQFTGGIDAQRPLLEQAYKSGTENVQNQIGQENRNKENVLAQARQLFSELQQGVQQRFGSTQNPNTTGGFANEFYGRELAKQQGKIQDTSGQNVKSLIDYGNQLKEKFDAQIQSLASQVETAKAQAKDVLYQRIQAIDSAKIGALQNKANMKLAALQEMNQQMANIQAQATQFAQQLYAQRQAADQELANQIKLYQQTGQTTPTGSSYGVQSTPIITNQQPANSNANVSTATGSLYWNPTTKKYEQASSF